MYVTMFSDNMYDSPIQPLVYEYKFDFHDIIFRFFCFNTKNIDA